MKKMVKSGQVMSLESYIAIVLILLVITGFYFILSAKENENVSDSANTQTGIDTEKVANHPILSDKIIDSDEATILETKNDCDELKKLFETDKNICIYFKDAKNNTIRFGNATGLGCPGINISDKICGDTT